MSGHPVGGTSRFLATPPGLGPTGIIVIADPTLKLRILRVADVSRDVAGGMRGYMLSSGAALEQRGHSVAYLFSENLQTPCIPRKLRRLVVPWLIAAKVLRSRRLHEQFDIIEIHEPVAFAYSLVRALLRGRHFPHCVVMSYGLEDRGWRAQRERWRTRGDTAPLRSRVSVQLTRLVPAKVGLRKASAVIVPSTADRRHLVDVHRLEPSRVVFVPTGVDPQFCEIVPKVSKSVSVLFVGSWIDRKGTPELVAAWKKLLARFHDLHLTVAGTGVEGDRVLADFPIAIRNTVHVHTTVDGPRLEELLASHQVFVLPSWFEGMPLSMLEAAAAGLPCVVCSVCGNVDFIREEDPRKDGGLLIPPHDAAALAAAVEQLIADPALRARLGARARARARVFTWAHTAERTETAYRQAMTSPHHSRRHPVRA